MDIDVKNAFDKAIQLCKEADNTAELKMTTAFIEDIADYIKNISIKNANQRFDYFCKVYYQSSYDAPTYDGAVADSISKTIAYFHAIDRRNNNASNVSFSKIIISFFAILGRYYMSSKSDKSEIDTSCVISQLNMMNEYIKNDTLKDDSKSEQVSKSFNAKVEPVARLEKTQSEQTSEDHDDDNDTLDELLDKLNSLIGLDEVKHEVNQMINLIKMQKKAEEFGLQVPPLSLHLVFSGNPGTGKTTVARIIAKIYKKLGVLSRGQLIETDRAGLVAGYEGQTATKTEEVVQKAMGGILFIDEAYTLTRGRGNDPFGQEAVDKILKEMEDHRDDFIVIVAGYPDLMKEFITSNPGLKSRFNQYIDFKDYTPKQLLEIFKSFCFQNNNELEDNCDTFLESYFENMYNTRTKEYANGRDVRNFFEKVIKESANRKAPLLDCISREDFVKITIADIQNAAARS